MYTNLVSLSSSIPHTPKTREHPTAPQFEVERSNSYVNTRTQNQHQNTKEDINAPGSDSEMKHRIRKSRGSRPTHVLQESITFTDDEGDKMATQNQTPRENAFERPELPQQLQPQEPPRPGNEDITTDSTVSSPVKPMYPNLAYVSDEDDWLSSAINRGSDGVNVQN